MNKFKSLLLLCLGFAFVAFPLSNQGFCNGDPVSVEVFSPCTGTVTVTQVCNGNDADVTITLSGSTGDDATATVSGGYTVSPAALGMSNGSFTLTIPAADLPASLTVSINITGAGCDAATVTPTPNPTTINSCATACQNCFAGNADIQDANGYPMEGGEVCGTTTELFEVGLVLNCDGMVGSAALPNRNVTFEFGTEANLVAGFEVFVNSEFLCTNAPISCAPFAENDNATSFAVPTSNVEVKIAPNPVTNIARISYELPEEGTTQVSVFDLKGNRIAVIASGYQASGIHTVDFDASNLAGGFYYLTVQTANTQVTERMVIVK